MSPITMGPGFGRRLFAGEQRRRTVPNTAEPWSRHPGGVDGPETTTSDPGGGAASRDLTFTAVDIDWERDAVEASAGELSVTLVNEGAIEHSWVVEDHEGDLRLYTQQRGQTDEGTLTLEAGEHTYYCDIPGHRAAGMEGTLTLE